MGVLEVPVAFGSTPNRFSIEISPDIKFSCKPPIMGFQKNILEHFPVNKHISRPPKIWALKSTWNPFKSQKPDLERKNISECRISRKLCKTFHTMQFLHDMATSFVNIYLQRTCILSHAFQTTHWRCVSKVILHAANLHMLPKSLWSTVQSGLLVTYSQRHSLGSKVST